MKRFDIKVENDHIQRVTSAKPLAALSELIWNAYDADAKEVSVEIEEGKLTSLELIRVRDDGVGFPIDKVETFFQSLGGSWKKRSKRTPGGRAIHGEKGQGRFKAFALGNRVTWTSTSGGQTFSVVGEKSDLKQFSISDVVAASGSGCIVEIEDIPADFKIRSDQGFVDQVRDVFALQLYEDPSFRLIYDGVEIDAKSSIKDVSQYTISCSTQEGEYLEATLDVVEWRKKVERKLLLCLPGRFSIHSMSPGIQARGFDFTAYLTAPHLQELADSNMEGLAELDKRTVALVEAAKSKLRDHFRSRESHRSRNKIQEWKDARIYPYEGQSANPIEVNERQVFDVVALNLSDYSPDFDKAPPKQQKLVLQLVKVAVESGASVLPSILEKVVDLPKGKQEELAELLRKTSLTAVINAAKAVTDRLEFLRALQILIYEPKSKRQLLERSQLHRVIAQETWIFGEEFNLLNDDEDLTSVLKSHLKHLGVGNDAGEARETLAPLEPVLDADGKVAIVDLMLSRRVPTPTDDERRHLVVELKRPSQKLNEDVINQIKKYAKAVAGDDRFRIPNVEWDFIAIANGFTSDAELEARQSGKPRGLVLELDDPFKVRVWARTWAEIIQAAEGRLTFYKRRLEYQATDVEALRYLKTINSDYLSDEVRDRIASLDNEEVATT